MAVRAAQERRCRAGNHDAGRQRWEEADTSRTVGLLPIYGNFARDFVLRVDDLTVALHDAADGVTLFPGALQDALYLGKLLGRDDEDHPNSHVERAEHLVLRNIAEVLQMGEDRLDGP